MSIHDDDHFDHDDDIPPPSKGRFPAWAIVLVCALPIVAVFVVGGMLGMFAITRSANVRQNDAQVQMAADRELDMSDRPAAKTGKAPSQKTLQMSKALKSSLASIEVHIYTLSSAREKDPAGVRLVTDPRKIPANSSDVFPISQKQAATLIDYMANSGVLDEWSPGPAGIQAPPAPGLHFVIIHRSITDAADHWQYSWWYALDIKPATVGVIQHLTQALDGEAKAAVERFCKESGRPK